ncbi:hypothetical protein ABEB36_012607 [Hypothenemus hampei]|uniref:Peptidase C1A papain C-terminal domain-containing protein n=1 Tax=Hypothenemus hampei TaxID=57062 RepID=A0ABD1EBT6_HYPHA
MSENEYPYKGEEQQCHFNNKSTTSLSYYGKVKSGCIDYIKAVVVTIGPVSVGIYPDKEFQMYPGREEILESPNFSQQMNHNVLVVRYETTHDGKDYWLVKNSWRDNWGINEFTRIFRNKNNQYGIANAIIYPVLNIYDSTKSPKYRDRPFLNISIRYVEYFFLPLILLLYGHKPATALVYGQYVMTFMLNEKFSILLRFNLDSMN